MGGIKQKISDENLITRFKDDCSIRGLSKHTIEGYVSTLYLFSTFLKGKGYSLYTIDREVLKTYIAHLRSSNSPLCLPLLYILC